MAAFDLVQGSDCDRIPAIRDLFAVRIGPGAGSVTWLVTLFEHIGYGFGFGSLGGGGLNVPMAKPISVSAVHAIDDFSQDVPGRSAHP
jgi:hypothetical protein